MSDDTTNTQKTEEQLQEEEDQKNGYKVIDKTTEQHKLSLEKAFFVEYNDPIGKCVRTGLFVAKKCNLGMLGRIGVLRARRNAGLLVDAQTDYLHHMMAQCEVSLTEFPKDWWTLDNLQDEGILERVYKEVVRYENSFRVVLPKRKA